MQKFCFICGNKTSQLIEGYCKDCYGKFSKRTEKIKKPSAIRSKQLKRHPDYYEAILQLRGFEESEIPKYLDKFRCEEVKGGMDIYVESKILARDLVKKLRKIFPVEIKKSFRLWGRKDGKNIYKNIISIRKINNTEKP